MKDGRKEDEGRKQRRKEGRMLRKDGSKKEGRKAGS